MIALSLTLTAAAEPTHSVMETTTWSAVTTAKHKVAGPVEVSKTTVAGVDCFRGQAMTDQPTDKLVAVVADVEGAVQWSSAGVTDAKLLSNGGGKYEYYQYLDVPGWTMASDRFWFLSSTVSTEGTLTAFRWSKLVDGGSHSAKYEEVKDAHPNAVEPTINVGGWYFDTQTDGTVQITYSICTQPGGSIPQAIQNMATKNTLPDTVGDVVREAANR